MKHRGLLKKQTTAKAALSVGGLVPLRLTDVQMRTPRAFLKAALAEIKRFI